MSWLEFFIRVFGWVAAVVAFLLLGKTWEWWAEKRRK
jgi:hypothetical protein